MKKILFDKKTIFLIIIVSIIFFGFYIINILSINKDNVEKKDENYNNLKIQILEDK